MISIAIPTISMKNGKELFTRCLNSLWDQSFQEFEIVVTDNSDDDTIKSLCDYYKTGIRYYKNSRKGISQNTNEAIKHSTGELVKILYMDDFLLDDEALELMVKKFKGQWLVSGCLHVDELGIIGTPHIPSYNERIFEGYNTIGSPSVLMIKNSNPLDGSPQLFDENLGWMLDCDYYKRLHDLYGEPIVLDKPLIGIGLHPAQATNTLGDEIKLKEQEYLHKKYSIV